MPVQHTVVCRKEEEIAAGTSVYPCLLNVSRVRDEQAARHRGVEV